MVERMSKSSNRCGGIFVPLDMLWCQQGFAFADIACLRLLLEWASHAGFRLLALPDITEKVAFSGQPQSVSSMAIDPLTLDVSPSAVPHLGPEDFARTLSRYGSLHDPSRTLEEIRTIKYTLLQQAFKNFWSEDYLPDQISSSCEAFGAFCTKEQDWLTGYCLFRYLSEGLQSSDWSTWPEECMNKEKASEAIDRLLESEYAPATEGALAFYAYVQWIAHEQWNAFRDQASRKGVALMADFSYAVPRNSADVFLAEDCFQLNWRLRDVEPDSPPYHWSAMRKQSEGAWLKQRVKKNSHYFSWLVLSNADAYYRVLATSADPSENGAMWIPANDEEWEDKASNCEQGEAILQALTASTLTRFIAALPPDCPPYIRQSIKASGLLEAPAVPIERNGDLLSTGHYPASSLLLLPGPGQPAWSLRSAWKTVQYAQRSDKLTQATKDRVLRAWEAWGKFARLPDTENYGESHHKQFLNTVFMSSCDLAVLPLHDLLDEEVKPPRLTCPLEHLLTDVAMEEKAEQYRLLMRKAERVR